MPKKKADTDDASSVRISRTVKKRLKVYSASIDKDMREVVDLVLDEYLKKRGA